MEGFKNQYQEGDMVCIQKVGASKNSKVSFEPKKE